MNDAIQFHSRVGENGVLKLQVDLGLNEAQKEVVVTIQPLTGNSATTEPELNWRNFIQQTYGSCDGLGLERPDQGAYEQRETLA